MVFFCNPVPITGFDGTDAIPFLIWTQRNVYGDFGSLCYHGSYQFPDEKEYSY